MRAIRFRRFRRKGLSGVQMALVLAGVILVVVVSVRFMGTATRGELNRTAGEVADPASLVNRFGSD